MYKTFVDTNFSPWVSFIPSLFAKSSFAFFGPLHLLNNKNIREKITLNLFKVVKLDQKQQNTLEFTTIDKPS